MATNPKPHRRKEKRWLRQYRSISNVKIRMKLSRTGERINRKHINPAFRNYKSPLKHYALKNKKPIVVEFLMWAMWFEVKQNRLVKHTTLPGGVLVSTIFLGLDQSFFGSVPLIFETMVFGGDHDGYQDRYATWQEAEAGHEKAVQLTFAVER